MPPSLGPSSSTSRRHRIIKKLRTLQKSKLLPRAPKLHLRRSKGPSSSWAALPSSSSVALPAEPSSTSPSGPSTALPAPLATPPADASSVHSVPSPTFSTSSQDLPVPTDPLATLWHEAIIKYRAATGVDLCADAEQLFESESAVHRYLEERENEFETFRAGGAQRLRDSLTPVAAALAPLCTIVGEGVSLAFAPSKVIFAAVGELFKAAVEVGDDIDAIGDTFDTLEHHLRILNHHAARDVLKDYALREESVKLLAQILVVLGVIRKVQKEGRLILWLKKLARSKEVSSALADLSRLAKNQNESFTAMTLYTVNETMTMLTKSDAWSKQEQAVTRESLARITKTAQEIHSMLQGNTCLTPDQRNANREILEGIQNSLRRCIDYTNVFIKTADVERLYQWLQYPDCSARMNNLLDDRTPSTGSWFLDGEVFGAFKRGTIKALWLQGKAGCGKSTLIAAAIRELQAGAASSGASTLIVSHLFDTTNNSQPRNLRALLSSFLCQLAYSRPDCARELLELRTGTSIGYSQLSLDMMRHHFVKMLEAPNWRISFVVDALDEIDDEQIVPFLAGLRTHANVSLLISSRLEVRFRKEVERLCDARIFMHESVVAGDIGTTLSHILCSGGTLDNMTDDSSKNVIKETLQAQADGNFRCTILHLQELSRVAGIPTKILLNLKTFPATLCKIYSRCLERVQPEDRDDVRRLLIWAIFSHRPLSKADFAQILSFDYSARMPIYDASQQPDADSVISLAGSIFISVHEDVVRLAHASVKDYILSLPSTSHFHIDQHDAYCLMARTSLAYITSAPLPGQVLLGYPHHLWWTWVIYIFMTRTSLPAYRLFWAWVTHIPRQGSSVDWKLQHDARRAIDRCSTHDVLTASLHTAADTGNTSLLRLLTGRDINLNQCHQRHKEDYKGTPLSRVAGYGHLEAARLLIDRGAGVDDRDEHGWTPLHIAAQNGHPEVARLLLDGGANVDALQKHSCTPLYIAAQNGHTEVVRLLLNKGADIEAHDMYDWTALHIASSNGHLEVVCVLVEGGATVDALQEDNCTPLFIAAQYGCLEVVQFLLHKGADIAVHAIHDWTALHIAASNGRLEVIQLLLSEGADIEAHGMYDRTALHVAAGNGHLEVVRLLVDGGAIVDALQNNSCTSLHIAAQHGRLEVVHLLLGKGANIEAHAIHDWTVLHIAARNGHLEVVRLLLAHGGNAEARKEDGQVPIHLAAQMGNLECARLLLDQGADVDARDNGQWTPLHLAAETGHLEVARLLVDRGADVEASRQDGWTSLQLAAQYNHLEVARLLLIHGAHVDDVDNSQWTPLHIAAHLGHLEVARLLIDQGTAIEARYDQQWTPLLVAANNGHLEISRLLLDRSADVNARDNRQGTPLHFAAHNSHLEVARLLLDQGADVDARSKDAWTPLHLAAQSGHLEVVRLLLDHGADVDSRHESGWAPVHGAAMNCHPEVVRLLIDRGAGVETREVHGWTPLHVAAYHYMEVVVRLLIDLGCDVDARMTDGRSPLDFMGGSPELPDDPGLRMRIRQMLLQAGATESSERAAETAMDSEVEGVVGEGGRNSAAED